ncbi:MAG TPA: DegT/DnrJ/EryC1/StrS family aminotransferase, partial [Chthoniobacteraceae bacterium]|nr:DegT/DnrJ/EryC1/StrS family aminotransferase [Chthoniobacteraceae bacterium]
MQIQDATTSTLALYGGTPSVQQTPKAIFQWPIITEEDEKAALDVIRRGAMSGTDVTERYEAEFAAWQGCRFALAFHNGTAALHAAMFACGVGRGDEVICPTITYWASALPAFSLGATLVFADIDPLSLCITPEEIERRITPRTKAIVVVHYLGHPAPMDAIVPLARKHGIKVIEDFSHAQGGHYKGQKVGTLGDVGATSLMSRKSLVAGEGGMLVCNDRELCDRAIAFGHHNRFTRDLSVATLREFAGLPLGGIKGRMHQVSAAVGRVQLRDYDERCRTIRQAMRFFWDCLDGAPGLRPHQVDESEGSNMAGHYGARAHYVPGELAGLSVTAFCRALRAEGVAAHPGCNKPLHLHPVFRTADLYHDGRPTRLAQATRNVLQEEGRLPVSEGIAERLLSLPWFVRYDEAV